jgi:hypothetical protein
LIVVTQVLAAVVVPVADAGCGLYELREAKRRATRPGAVRVTIGAPVEFPSGSDPNAIARELEQRVRALAWPL